MSSALTCNQDVKFLMLLSLYKERLCLCSWVTLLGKLQLNANGTKEASNPTGAAANALH